MTNWDAFANWIATKGQIDFGNFAVGVATILVASASFLAIHRQKKSLQSDYKLRMLESKITAIRDFIVALQRLQLEAFWHTSSNPNNAEQSIPIPKENSIKIYETFNVLSLYLNLENSIDKELLLQATSLAKVTGKYPAQQLVNFQMLCQKAIADERKRIYS